MLLDNYVYKNDFSKEIMQLKHKMVFKEQLKEVRHIVIRILHRRLIFSKYILQHSKDRNVLNAK